MYKSDDRFRQTIDRHGQGLTSFLAEAIRANAARHQETEVGARRLRRPAEVLRSKGPDRRKPCHFTEINGAQLDVRERGSGEAVIFVHGAMGDECAAIVKEPVLINHFRVIDYHRRGWGNSSIPAMPVTMQQQIADCKAILKHLDVQRAHFAGQSGGGQVVLQMAQDAPEIVHSVAVLKPALFDVIFSFPAV